MEGNECLVHNALAGYDERAIAGTSYMSSLGLRNPKDENGCKLTTDFNHCSSISRGYD